MKLIKPRICHRSFGFMRSVRSGRSDKMTPINNHTQHQDGSPQSSHTHQPPKETFQITDKQSSQK